MYACGFKELPDKTAPLSGVAVVKETQYAQSGGPELLKLVPTPVSGNVLSVEAERPGVQSALESTDESPLRSEDENAAGRRVEPRIADVDIPRRRNSDVEKCPGIV